MPLSDKQSGVAKGMGAGVMVTLAGMAGMVALFGRTFGGPDRAGLCAVALLAPALALAFSIARLARHRFFNAEDIDGSASSAGSDTARQLQSLLQNTLEQAVLAALAYAGWCALAPDFLMPALPAAALLFLLGRILFFAGYAHGAQSRAFGFALTFYPTLALVFGDAGFVIVNAAGLLRQFVAGG